ncbi:MAG: extracellular matrix/biofilm biosynthesis regulator RemA family protein [Chloroflexota bacterium]
MTRLISVGKGGFVEVQQIVAAGRANSSPIKRLLKVAGIAKIVDLTYGEPRQSVIVLNNGFLAIVSLSLEALVDAIEKECIEIE